MCGGVRVSAAGTAAEASDLARGCVLAGFVGPRVPAWLAAELDAGLAGVTLFASNVSAGTHSTRELVAELRVRRPGAVVAIDEEGGEVTRLDAASGSRSVGAAALGAADDVRLTENEYADIGRRLAEIGVSVDLAPVADVNSDPRNPVIGLRSFGADPDLVCRHVSAAVRGLQSAGVHACAKHFCGHGDTQTDSHTAVARIERDAEGLRAVELPPFVAAIDAGTAAIMTGHLLLPALDPDHVATLSPAITTGLLRRQLGFTGAVITDALEMAAVADTVGVVEGAVQALIAGADCLCIGAQEHPEAIAAIPPAVARAVEDGRLPLERLREAAGRTAALGVAREPSAAIGARIDAAASGLATADRAVRVLGTLPDLRAPVVVEYHTASSIASGELRWSLGAALEALRPDVRTVVLAPGQPLDRQFVADPHHSLVLVVRDPLRHDEQRAALDAVRGTDAVVVDVGWPSVDVSPAVITYGTAPALLAAAARCLNQARPSATESR